MVIFENIDLTQNSYNWFQKYNKNWKILIRSSSNKIKTFINIFNHYMRKLSSQMNTFDILFFYFWNWNVTHSKYCNLDVARVCFKTRLIKYPRKWSYLSFTFCDVLFAWFIFFNTKTFVKNNYISEGSINN